MADGPTLSIVEILVIAPWCYRGRALEEFRRVITRFTPHRSAQGQSAAAVVALIVQDLRMAHAFYTIGHGRRPIGEFVDLLRDVEVTLLADVRIVPRSRANPQYNEDALPQALQPFDIAYTHMTDLGGLRGRQKSVAPEINGFWENESFHNYADYAMSERFRSALAHLRERGRTQRCAIMCAETVWWRCHRRIITDYLLAAGETVFHILGPGQVEAAAVNEVAQLQGAGTLVYPAEPAS